MKAKLDFKSKRTIIITAIIAVLALGAGVGGYFYAKGNNQAGATNGIDGSQVTTEQPNTDTPSNNNPDNNATDANNDNGADGTTATTNDATDANTDSNNGTTATNNRTTGTGTATGRGTTGTTTATTPTGTTNNNQNTDTDATTTYENVVENIVVEEPWESHNVNWTPEKLNTSIPEVNVNKPQLESTKTAYVQGEEITNTPVNTAIQKDGEITYVINIKNTGDIDASKVMVYDNVPEGTELVQNEEGTIENIKDNDGKDIQRIVWEKDVKAGEEVNVSFTVKVTADSINLIENTAKVNGEDTDKTQTPVLSSSKKAILVDENRELKKEDSVKVGQKVKYVITAENTSDVDAVTTISDVVPEGTENATEITKPGELKDGIITWKNITVKAGEKTEVSFVVTVSNDTVKAIKNAAKVADTDTPSVETKVANITTKKTSEASATPLKEKDTITYTLIATNKGDGEGKVTISDEIPTGTTLVGKIKEGNNEYSEEELKSGIEVTVPANGGKKEITFTVQINKFELGDEGVTETEDGTLTRSIKNEKAKQDGTPTNPTDDTVEKAYVQVKVSKHWEDNDTQKLRRPEKIRFVLLVDGEESEQYYDMDTTSDAEYEFTKLPKYKENFEEISYAITEKEINKDDLKFYTTASTASEPDEDGNIEFVVTNTFETPNDKAEIQVEKVWNDNKNEAGKRPEKITLQVNGNGKTENVVLTGNANGEKWTAEVKLPKYNDNGEEIVYTATETETGSIFYVKESENGLTVTNKFEVPNDTKPVEVEKVWNDNKNEAGKRPEKITLQVNGNGKTENVELTGEANGEKWTATVDLPKYDAKGDEITYTATETETGSIFYVKESEKDLTVTNKFEVPNDTKPVEVEKVWNDNNNEAGKRPEKITLQVSGDGKTEKVELTGDAKGEKWTETVNLPKYDAKGDEITYTATETETGSIFYVKESENGLTVTNKFEVPNDTKPVEVEKVWNDNKNEAGKRPEKITLQVNGNGKTENVELTGEANVEKWTETVNLPKYDAKGDEITYTATETETGSIFYVKESENGLTVTNKFEVPNDTKPVTVTKVWDYEDDNVKLPTSIKLEFDDGTNKTEKSLTGTGKEWTQTYDMPVYDAKGNVITYKVDEKTGADEFVKISLETNGDNTTITNAKPDLSVEKEVYSYIKDGEEIKANAVTVEKVGDIVGFKIIVTNTGKVDLKDIEVKDTIKGGVFFDYTKPNNKTTIIDDELDLKAGAEPKEYIVYYEITADDIEDSGKTIDNSKTGEDKITGDAKSIINTVVASATYEDENGKNQTVKDSDDASIGITEVSKITSTKSSDKSEAEERVIPGDTITYTITVKNDGNMIQKNVKVTDTMTIDGAERADLKISNIRCDKDITTDNGIITINELGIGETATITATYKVQDKDMSETSIRKIKNKIIVDNDNNPHEDEVETEKYKTDITVEKKSELHKKSGNTIEGKAEYGDTIKYTIIAKNSGKKPGEVVIEDDLTDLGVEVKTNGETNLTDEEIAELAETMKLEKTVTVPGEDEVEITFEVTVVSKPGRNITNTATFGPKDDDKTSDEGYDVEKKVKISTKSEITTITNSNVVLVVDVSGSMEKKSRLTNAKTAAKKLIDGLKFSDNDNSGSAVAVVTFSSDGYSDNATTIGTAEKTTQVTQLKNKIDNLSADGGTRIAAGLAEAKTQIEALKAKRPDNNNVVIVLSDGNFSLSWDQNTISESGGETLSRIRTQASALRNSSAKPTVYTIAFGSEAINSSLNVLKDDIATSDSTYFEANDSLDSLIKAFSKISSDIDANNEHTPTASNKGLVELPNIDTSKDKVTVIVDGESSEVSLSSLTHKDGKYYVDLSNYDADADIEIEYFVTE